MVDVLKAFYSVHYNFGILAIIILLIGIFFATKKMWIFLAITVAVVLVMNVVLYKMTDGKSWTIEAAVVKNAYALLGNTSLVDDIYAVGVVYGAQAVRYHYRCATLQQLG